MKSIKLLAAALLGASGLSAQVFVAGWDFDNTNGVESVPAQWGAQKNTASFYWNGTGGSTDLLTPDFEETFDSESGFVGSDATVGNTFLVIDAQTGFNEFSDNFGGTVSHLQFQSFSGSLNGDRAVIAFSGSGFGDLSMQFAARNSGSGLVSYSYSTDGVNFTNFETGVSYGTAFELDTLDLSALNGAATAYIGVTFSGTGSETFGYDNIQITGTAVPEPASFAALAGLAGLGFAASRRRRVRG